MSISQNIAHAWKTLRYGVNAATKYNTNADHGPGNSRPAYKLSSSFSISSLSKVVYNRIATDAASVKFQHVRTDEDDQTVEVMKSGLQNCLSLEANIDQTSIQFFHDLVFSLCDEDAIAVVPTNTTLELNNRGAYDILDMRIGRITQWFSKHIEVELYNEETGRDEREVFPKGSVAILENPFSEILSDDNSTLKRLKRKMALLDNRDEEISAGKLNMIVQLPTPMKGRLRKEQAETRRHELENQLKGNAYGIAYTGIDEKIIPLNQPIDNDLVDQVKYLRTEFYNQLGLTETVFNGTASENEMNQYYARAIDPILTTIVMEFKRKFLTKTARSQGQDIIYTRSMLNSIPLKDLAAITEILVTQAVASPNEMRGAFGFPKSSDPSSNKLMNRNINPEGGVLDESVIDDPTGSAIESDLLNYYLN